MWPEGRSLDTTEFAMDDCSCSRSRLTTRLDSILMKIVKQMLWDFVNTSMGTITVVVLFINLNLNDCKRNLSHTLKSELFHFLLIQFPGNQFRSYQAQGNRLQKPTKL